MNVKKNVFFVLIGFSFFLAYGLTEANAKKTSNSIEMSKVDTIPATINHDMLRMLEAFRERGTITESFYYQLLQDQEANSAEGLRHLLNEYTRAINKGEDPLQYEEFVEYATEELESIFTPHEMQSQTEQSTWTEPGIKEQLLKQTKETAEISTTNSFQETPGKQDIARYHIQIAASATPLSESYLKNLYSGEKEIHHFQEDHWEKYYIGHFYSFSDARVELRRTNITEAFIISYVNNQKVLPYIARQVESVFSTTSLQTFHNDPADQFRIQIAASRSPIHQKELQNLTAETGLPGIIFQDGWYKYSLPGASTLSESWDKARRLDIKGAFVVRYQKGKLLPLR